MRIKILIIAFLSILTLNLFAQEGIFEKIVNKTWFEDNGFAGTTIVFYRTTNGLLKAIRQINGSGVPVVGSEIYDVEIRNDTVYLLGGLNLKTSVKINNYFYSFDKKTEQILKDGKQLKKMFEEAILFSWIDNKRDVKTQIDLNSLREIRIEKNQIYKELDLVKIQINK